MCFTMLKIPNRWLQWLQNVQKPLAGLFRHLVWPKIEEDRLPGSSPSNLLSLDRQNAPLFLNLAPHVHIYVLKPSTGCNRTNGANCRTVRAHLAPNRQGRGHMWPPYDPRAYKKGPSFKTKVMDKWRAVVV
jgi:hypothetical protein